NLCRNVCNALLARLVYVRNRQGSGSSASSLRQRISLPHSAGIFRPDRLSRWGMWFLDGVWVADRVLHSVVFSVERCTFLRPHQFHDLNCFVQPSYPDRCFLGEWSPVSLVLRQISEFLMNS